MASKLDQVLAGSLSDVGRIRDRNEDTCLVDANRGLFIVSDGMGGAQAGELASEIVIRALPLMVEAHLAQCQQTPARLVRRSLRDIFTDLNQQMYNESLGRVGLRGMGATVVLVLIRKQWAHIAHMGDSRVYLWRSSGLEQLTADHTLVGTLLRSGEITPRQAETHPARGHLTRFMGMGGEVYPDVKTIGLKKGDRLLLCSDGLTGMISDSEITTILATNEHPQRACEMLVTSANQAGGADNITAVVVKWK
ncbi:Stp1/IreP family PP2C-type Ser/Thr phosphatase [Planctomycetota bacterium]